MRREKATQEFHGMRAWEVYGVVLHMGKYVECVCFGWIVGGILLVSNTQSW